MLAAYATVRRWHAPLAVFAAVMTGLALVCVAGLLVDDRVLGGMPVWAKPLKFSLSFTAYAVTLAWLLSLLPRPSRLAHRAASVVAGASVLEMVAIVGQAARGRASHFNVATPLDAAVFATMGVLVAVIYGGTLVVAAVLVRARLRDAAVALAVRLGLLVSVAGMSVGFLMLLPSAAQQADAAAGRPELVSGAHAVGVLDGGPSLPLLGWSTTGGDLRVPHFLGMHGLQVMALVALVLATRWGRGLDEPTRRRSVWLVATAYVGVCGVSLWQALRGQPVTAPDATTVLALAALSAVVAAGALAVVRARGAGRLPAPSPTPERTP